MEFERATVSCLGPALVGCYLWAADPATDYANRNEAIEAHGLKLRDEVVSEAVANSDMITDQWFQRWWIEELWLRRLRNEANDSGAHTESDNSDVEESDEESQEEAEAPPKKKAKKKPAKQESESDSDDDAPIGSLNKPKVTDALLAEKVKEMAESSDFETLSLKIIRERLAETLGQDMGPYKKQIKAVVIKAIGGE